MKTVILALILGLTSTLGLNSALAAGSQSKGAKPMSVRMTTNHGDIIIELDADKAPVTVANFLSTSNPASSTARSSIASFPAS